MTDDSASCSELDLVLSRLGRQGHLVEVVKVGVAHGSLCRDSLGWVIHLATSYSKGGMRDIATNEVQMLGAVHK